MTSDSIDRLSHTLLDQRRTFSREVQDFLTKFMSTLDLVLEAFPKEGWRSLEEHYLPGVTLVVLGDTTKMKSLLR